MRRPSEADIKSAWKRYKYSYDQLPKAEQSKIDCGDSARDVAVMLGGKRGSVKEPCKTTLFRLTRKWNMVASTSDISEAKHRGWRDSETPDKIVGAILHVHFGAPATGITVQKHPLKRGMLIYSAENARNGRWVKQHMVMYVGQGRVADRFCRFANLDQDGNGRIVPRKLRAIWGSDRAFFSVLRLEDPFA